MLLTMLCSCQKIIGNCPLNSPFWLRILTPQPGTVLSLVVVDPRAEKAHGMGTLCMREISRFAGFAPTIPNWYRRSLRISLDISVSLRQKPETGAKLSEWWAWQSHAVR